MKCFTIQQICFLLCQRRSERDMPECSSNAEACNLAHRRYWITPVTERLCRCSDRSECPLHFTDLHDPLSQHVSNRAQFKVKYKIAYCKAFNFLVNTFEKIASNNVKI